MSSNSNIFKKIIIFYVLYIIGYLFFEMFTYSTLSEGDGNDADFNILDILILICTLIYFYLFYLLYKFKPLGKKVFIPFLILFEILGYFYLTLEDFTQHNHKIFYYLDFIDYFLTGVIVTFLYFTDLKKEFEKN